MHWSLHITETAIRIGLPRVKREQKLLHESWWELRSENLYESFLHSHVLVKREQEFMGVNKCWEATVCMRVFTTLISWKTRTRVAWELMRDDPSENLYKSFRDFHVLVKRVQELHQRWRELTSESLYESFLNSHVQGQTGTKVAWYLMRVDQRGLYQAFLNSHVLVKREVLHESWWKLTSESLYESFFNSRVLVKREEELYKNCCVLTSESS